MIQAAITWTPTRPQAEPSPRTVSRAAPLARAARDRAAQLLRTEIDFIASKTFQEIDRPLELEACQTLCRHEVVPASVPANLPGHLARLCESSVLSAEQERELFRRMNYLKYRANVLRSRLDPACPDLDLLERAERFLEAARNVRERLIKANMRLAISIVKKFVSPRHSFDDLLSDGICSLMQAVDKFDYERGFRFSTYAYRSIARNAYRMLVKCQRDSMRFSTEVDEATLESTMERTAPSMDMRTWGRLRDMLSRVMHRLDRREQLIIRAGMP